MKRRNYRNHLRVSKDGRNVKDQEADYNISFRTSDHSKGFIIQSISPKKKDIYKIFLINIVHELTVNII